MRKNHRSRHREKQAEQQRELARQAETPPHIFKMSGFDGANFSTRRGWIERLPLDTSREATGNTLCELLRRSRWLVANNGYAGFIVEGLSRLIGYHSVQPATKDKEWNRLAEASWRNRTKLPSVFDRAGKLNHATWQLSLSRRRLRDGDALDVLMQADSGAALIVPYESHQIADGAWTSAKPDALRDGVFIDKFGRHVAYRLVDPQDPNSFARVDASSCIYYADQTSTGRVRAIPPLAHAINDLLDISETFGDIKQGVKLRHYLGVYRKRQQQGAGPMGLFTEPTPTAIADTTSTTTSGGTGATQRNLVNLEDAQANNGIAGLAAGEDLGTISLDSPGPNEQAFVKMLLEKVALGLGLPPSVVFMIAGLNGPEVRLHMGLLKRWIEIELLRLLIAVQKHYFYWLACEFRRGALPFPRDPNWWNAIYVPQADLTIDRGREGKLALEELRVGATTLADVWEQKGADWEDKLEAQATIIARAAEIAASHSLGLADIMPGWANPNGAAPVQQSDALTTDQMQ